jgi:serine/threonine protein phosphatase PrpC
MNEYKTNHPPKMLAIGVGAVSEIGQREQNQDRMSGFHSPFGAVYLVADGMGGHKGGAEASRMVAEAFSRHLMNAPASSPPQDALTLAVRLANLEILEKGRSGNPEFEGMGSTVVIALIQETSKGMELITAHVGDSRIYLRRDEKLTQLTKDHTQVQWLIDTNALDEVSARNHPDASVLTRAMGHSTDLQVDISGPIPLVEGDILLLCSDGLSGFANAEDIDRTIAQNPDPTKCANRLVQLALNSGSNDNITVQVLRVGNAAQSRRRSRKTDPGTVIVPATPSFWSNPWLLISVAVILIAAGLGYYWFRTRPTPPSPKTNPQIIDNHKKTDKLEGKEPSKKNSGEEEKPPQAPNKPGEAKPESKKPVEQELPSDSQKPKPPSGGKTVPKPPAKPTSKPPAGTSTDDSGDAPNSF